MAYRGKLGFLAMAAVLLVILYLFIDAGSNWDYVLPRRLKKILAIMLTGAAIAFSTVVFQTITNNRILTPSMIGLDSLYLLVQTSVVYLFGATTLTMMNSNVQFLISVGAMILFAGVLYKFLFRKEGQHIYFLLLVGFIFGTLFSNLSSFMEMLIDPNEFMVVQDRMFASFNNINTDLLLISFLVVLATAVYFMKYAKFLDVLSLGKEHAVNLGIPYDLVVKRLLIIVAVLISISTALVGPITFLGLLVVNIVHQFIQTYRHTYLISGSILVSVIALAGGQLIVERVFTFSTTLSVIINFIGGVYFIYLLLKENKSW
ncbi:MULTISPECIES: iron chelate uptake ABC transporter family permease subunit [Paenibacillus]|uniref:FecCD transport family protein n=1 Tax=Paenibacillus naphthalenovorans TaxID=162209 RepID=A0A0U2M2B3_9BACL|nr:MULTISPECIES: iron chelate uptake ABC transporter family permease subunit [Paenibacillus]ALS21392.1 FecCD transport family protein [Paenibacillus naphthalenovorans]NTZ18444.1 iron ABC transporter permease [Paenibacillus sp. JMULE4]GCL72651.1 iron ABC transporter permease [Paenibacillus naphthalenovorans]